MDCADRTLREFRSAIASEAVTPAGGTAAAVAGAIGASVCEMACVHTIGTDEDTDGEMVELRDDLQRYGERLLELADRDADVVEEVFTSSEEPVGQTEIKRSIGVPLTIAKACLTVIERGVDVIETCARPAVPDATTGVLLAHSALRAAVFTVRSNIDQLSDTTLVERIRGRVSTIEECARRHLSELPDDTDWRT